MNRLAISVANPIAGTAVSAGDVYPLTQVEHRIGCGIALSGNAVELRRAGFYKVDAVVNFEAGAAGPVTVTLLQNGVAVPGATVTETSAADVRIALPISTIVRVDDAPTRLTLVVSAAGETVNATMNVVKM